MLIMNLIQIIKQEFNNFNKPELFISLGLVAFVLLNAIITQDSPASVGGAVFGILYTIMAGKGKISCYIFGLIGSSCYAYLAFRNALWGNLLLSAGYYIPMEILGFFGWKKHLKKNKSEIVKTRLDTQERVKLFAVGLIGSIVCALILAEFKDSKPLTDGVTTFLSILGMYLTVRRRIEQWIVWTIVNATSCVMWTSLIIFNGSKAYSTVVMWAVYLVLGIYFYREWARELSDNHD